MSEQLTITEVKEVWQQGYEDPWFFCQFFLPHWFRKEPSWFHLGLLALLTKKVAWLDQFSPRVVDKIIRHFVWKVNPEEEDSPEIPIFYRNEEGQVCMNLKKFTLVMVPRGFGKTTTINAANLYALCYKECKFLLYVSESGPHSQAQLKNVKNELEGNNKIKVVFGEQRPQQRSGAKWTEDWAQCTNGVNLVARGRGAQIRGLLLDGFRPDRVMVDDVEDDESVKTEDQRQKVREWAYRTLLPALQEEEEEEDVTLIATGTLLHSEALLAILRQDPEFNTVVLEAIDRDGDPLWPEHMDLEDLERKKTSFALAGMLAGYYLEYHNSVRADETAKFRKEFFIYTPPEQKLIKALAVDPAISEKKGADFFALAVTGMDDRGIHHVLDVMMKRGVPPREQVDLIFRYSTTFFPVHFHGIEAVAFQRALIHLVQEEMFSRNHYFEVVPILHGATGKVERVEGILQPRYAAGYMRHSRQFPEYEKQLLDWPRGKRDGPDVVAMAISLCDPAASRAANRNIPLTAPLPELPEEVLDGEWRRAV